MALQQAPTPRAAEQVSALGCSTAENTAQFRKPGRYHSARPSSTTVVTLLCQLPNRLDRSQGSRPSVLIGAGRGAMGSNVAATAYLSLMAARLLYQFMNPLVDSEVVRYTSMMMAMHSTARPVWLIAVLVMETTSG